MEEADEFLAALAQCQDGEQQIAVINRWKGKRDGQGRFQPRAARGERREPKTPAASPKTSERGPRKCPNCNGTHESRTCPKPGIAVKDRLCFECNLPGHSAQHCPTKKALKAIEDQPAQVQARAAVAGLAWLGMVQDDGYQRPKKTSRPMPRQATLADWPIKVKGNRFAVF